MRVSEHTGATCHTHTYRGARPHTRTHICTHTPYTHTHARLHTLTRLHTHTHTHALPPPTHTQARAREGRHLHVNTEGKQNKMEKKEKKKKLALFWNWLGFSSKPAREELRDSKRSSSARSSPWHLANSISILLWDAACIPCKLSFFASRLSVFLSHCEKRSWTESVLTILWFGGILVSQNGARIFQFVILMKLIYFWSSQKLRIRKQTPRPALTLRSTELLTAVKVSEEQSYMYIDTSI